jgi:uncharacterized damage-inducible protein DinB
MTQEFRDDLARLKTELADARKGLLSVVDSIADGQLDSARRGGWSVRHVLDHVISSEHAYARLVAHLRKQPMSDPMPPTDPTSAADARAKLGASHETLLNTLEGVGEDEFYEIGRIGHEEYSIMSILENARAHDHEHSGQLSEVLRGA